MVGARQVRVRAHAKINLALHIRGTRPDGYHDLQTVFQSLALHDTLTCTVRKGPFIIRCDDEEIPVDGRNLVWRAAESLWRALGRDGQPRGAAVAIAKQIPVQAGLGGGSADAAAALVALSWLWAGRRHVDLGPVAASIGADVPFFLIGGTALGLERGDDLFPLPDLMPHWVVLAWPGFGVATADAYRWCDHDAGPSTTAAGSRQTIAGWPGRTLLVHNDLQDCVERRHPDIGRIRRSLSDHGACAAAMTGSGSAVFGLFGSAFRARRAAVAVAGAGSIAIVTRTIDRRAATGGLRARR